VQTGSVEDETITAVSGVTVTRFATADLMFVALDAGTVDAIFLDTPVVPAFATTYDVKTILQLAAELTVLYTGRNADSLLIEINAAISAGLQDGTIDGLVATWL
jgi:ABC-type amino acid transport substrate-binding protein